MDSEEERDKIIRAVKPQKSVQIVDNRQEIIEVREKHGPLYNAIPKMPVPLAILCCILNIGLPGIGESYKLYNLLNANIVTDRSRNVDCFIIQVSFTGFAKTFYMKLIISLWPEDRAADTGIETDVTTL